MITVHPLINWSGRLQDYSFQTGGGKVTHFQYQLPVQAKNELHVVLFNAWSICIADLTSIPARRTKSFNATRKSSLRLVELQNLVAKSWEIQKI